MEAEKYERSAQATVWNFIYGYTETLVLKCAVQLDIPTIIHNHGKPMSISQLSSHLPNQPIDQDRLYRIMRYLVHLKFFTKWLIEGETRFGLAPPAKFLIKGWDKSMVPIVLAMTDKNYMASWHYVKEGLVGDKVALEKALGMGIWDYMADHPEMSQRFNEAMASDTRLVTSALVSEECKGVFEGIASLVDVGGGTGTALRSIAKAFPNVKCTLYDLPHVISNSPRYPEISCVEGDMFKYIPRADAVLMKCILHDWGDKECIEILKRCKEAVPRDGGKVIIVDIVIDTQSTHPYTKMRLTSDLDMMLNTGGKERSEEEWKNLILAAGYSGYNITQISAVPSVIEAFPY